MKQTKLPAIKDSYRYFAIVAFMVMLAFGIYHIRRVVQSGNEEYGEITRIAQTAATMMHFDDLIALNAVSDDASKVQYLKLKAMLMQIKRINKSAKFSYIYTMRNGKVLFMVDSEPANSPGFSPPGQVFEEATQVDKELMDEGKKMTIEFSKDHWGNWVSILVPLKHPVTHKTFAVFGMDFDAKVWRAIRWNDLLLASFIVVLSLVAILFLFINISSSQKLKKEYVLLKETELELLKAKEKAEESDRLKTSFLKNISHEIRTPMNSILGFANLLKEKDVSTEYREMFLLNMINSGQRMLNTMNDIIDYSRIQADQITSVMQRTNMSDQLCQLHEMFLPIAKEKGIEFKCLFSPQDNDLFYFTDTDMLHSIFKKLLWNAFKFTSKGYVEIGYQIKDTFIEFYVKDTGVGMDETQKAFIFKYFRQGNESMNRNYEGTGLGLAIAKAYVEMLGGSIWVESEPEIGSVFTFTIEFHKIKQ